jgi:hypothetical protein
VNGLQWEWEEFRGVWKAPSVFGEYTCWVIGEYGCFKRDDERLGRQGGSNEAEAKAAAQLDHDTRIRSADIAELVANARKYIALGQSMGVRGENASNIYNIAERLANALEALGGVEPATPAEADPAAWLWRVKKNNEWQPWEIAIGIDPNDWLWHDYWQDLENEPLYSAATLAKVTAERDSCVDAAIKHEQNASWWLGQAGVNQKRAEAAEAGLDQEGRNHCAQRERAEKAEALLEEWKADDLAWEKAAREAQAELTALRTLKGDSNG